MKPQKNQTAQTRLNKYISESGIASRRKAEEFITQGRVSVNEKIISDLSYKVNPGDTVKIDGEKITPKKHVYYLLNKPKGCVTTTDDEKNRRTVLDFVNTNEKIYPVGRLDYNTTGVLVLTNDGEFSYLLTHPKNKVPRQYEVKLDRPLSDEDREKLLKGVFLEGIRGRFQKVYFPNIKNRKSVEVTGIEGRNHYVKKMFGALGYTVTSLNRNFFAGLIPDVPVGKYRKLTETEVKEIIEKYNR